MKACGFASLVLGLILVSCVQQSAPDRAVETCAGPVEFDRSHIFPEAGALRRPEDGAMLPDGRIVVSDQYSGLWLVDGSGVGRPFGKFGEAGFRHDPPGNPAGPNGLFLEPDGQHLLMADLLTGKIYRINLENEAVSEIYDHPWGVNALCRDSLGGLWFTQSLENGPGSDFGDVRAGFDDRSPKGSVWYLPYRDGQFGDTAVIVAANLHFANGICLDVDENFLYVAETNMDRIIRFAVSREHGLLLGGDVFWQVGTPDNIRFDDRGRLLVASLVYNRVYAIDPACQRLETVYQAPSAANRQMSAEWQLRTRRGEKVSDLLNPDLCRPLDGMITGMFPSNNGRELYVTGNGSYLLRAPF